MIAGTEGGGASAECALFVEYEVHLTPTSPEDGEAGQARPNPPSVLTTGS